MKTILTFLAGVLVAASAWAGPLQFTDASIQTNNSTLATQTPDDDGFVSGWIDTVIFDITAGTTSTNTIILKTLGDTGGGASRTLLTVTSLTADGVYPVRDLVTTQAGVDIANTPARIPLQQDKLRLTATNNGSDTNAAASTMTVYVIMSPVP